MCVEKSMKGLLAHSWNQLSSSERSPTAQM